MHKITVMGGTILKNTIWECQILNVESVTGRMVITMQLLRYHISVERMQRRVPKERCKFATVE